MGRDTNNTKRNWNSKFKIHSRDISLQLDLKNTHLSYIVILLLLFSLVVWLAVNTAELPRIPMPLCKLYFNWLYSWKPTLKMHSKGLTSSISKYPSLLTFDFPTREGYDIYQKGKEA